jgi:hypothetical protein
MKVKQLSVFLENESGRLAEVTSVLGEAGINIRALSLADTSEFGILRLIVNDIEKAQEILHNLGFTLGETEVLAVEIPDKPGGLASVLQALAEYNINVEYMYAFVDKPHDTALSTYAIVIFRFEDIDGAISALQSANIKLLPAQQVYSL